MDYVVNVLLYDGTVDANLFRIILKEQALPFLIHHLKKILDLEDVKFPDNAILELELRGTGLEYIAIPGSEVLHEFVERANDLNYNFSFPQKKVLRCWAIIILLRVWIKQRHQSGMSQ